MNLSFSAKNRNNILLRMAEQELDLLVIGGGITGAGIILDANERGMRTGLIEKNDFGSGTSSRSTKLIHGGLRYLKQGEIKLVREVSLERAVLHKIAPHLVVPRPMLLPIYQGGTFGYFSSSVGLYVYDLLAGVTDKERRKIMKREEALRREPLLKREGLKGAGLYYEYGTHDARLTLEIIKTAAARGALAVNYTEFTEFLYKDGIMVGIEVVEQISGRKERIYAKNIVNAAGPWVEEVRIKDNPLQGKRLLLTKGVHIVIDFERLPVKQAAYFDTADGRMVFVIPRGRVSYVGTTDTVYLSSVDEPEVKEEDRNYLINAVNRMFPDVRLTVRDIISQWAGVRPLIHQAGKGASEVSRKDEIFYSESGLMTIAGGKLTGYRKMAEKVVNLAAQKLKAVEGRSFPDCTTDRLIISGGEDLSNGHYDDWKREIIVNGIRQGVARETMEEWTEMYGTNTMKIIERFTESSRSAAAQETRSIHAQLDYSIEEEMTVAAADFLRLRTGWAYFQVKKAARLKTEVLAIMKQQLQWNEKQEELQKSLINQLFKTLSYIT